MQSQKGKLLRTMTVTLALLALGIVTVTTAASFFGGTKIRPLFGMSAEALAGQHTATSPEDTSAPDAGLEQTPDAGGAVPAATPPAP